MKETFKKLWKDESAQGATEYILILVVIVGVAMLFREQFEKVISDKISDLSSKVGGFGN